MQHGTADVAD